MNGSMLRSASVLALAPAALSAHALDAFSNLAPAPDSYATASVLVGGPFSQGFQFTSGLSGGLAGFRVAMNDFTTPNAFTISLYADSGSNTLGALLGAYSGVSSGAVYGSTHSALATVAASGPSLTAGGKYWLVASATRSNQVTWALSYGPKTTLTYSNGMYNAHYGVTSLGAFSVQVQPISPAVPGPAALGPFALGALATRRKRRRA